MNTIIYPRMHVSCYVSNIAASISFYEQFFGVAPTKLRKDYAKFELIEPSLVISFLEAPEKVQNNFGHLGFQVASTIELQNILDRIKNLGFNFLEENNVSCCYALQDKFWVTDPDGIRWEVYYFHEDVTFNDPQYSADKSCSGVDCC